MVWGQKKYEYMRYIIVEICITWVGFSCWSSTFYEMLLLVLVQTGAVCVSRWRWTNYTNNFTNTSRLYSLNVCGKMLTFSYMNDAVKDKRSGHAKERQRESIFGGDFHVYVLYTQRYKPKMNRIKITI